MTVIQKVKNRHEKYKNIGLLEMQTTICEIKLNGIRLITN